MTNVFQKLYNIVDYELYGLLPYGTPPYWEVANVGEIVYHQNDMPGTAPTTKTSGTTLLGNISSTIGNISTGAIIGVVALLYFVYKR